MTSSDRWLSHYSFRLRNLTRDSPAEGLDGSFRRMAQELAKYETPITFQVQLLDGEKYLSWCLELTPSGSTVQATKRDHPDFELITQIQTWREIIAGSLAPFEAFVQGKMRVRGDVKLGRRLLRQIASPEDKPEVRERQIPQIPQANILFTTGWVDCVTVRDNFGGVQITEVFTSNIESFIIWQGGPPSASDSLKVSLLREALAKDLTIDIFHFEGSALIDQLSVYSHGPKRNLPPDASQENESVLTS
jgi:putative sterol carrier protein